MPKLLAVAGKLLRRAGRFVFSPCPQCCQDQADKSWIIACSCITWNPANWTVSTPCNVPQNRCVYVCLGSFLSDNGTLTIAQRLEAIRAAWYAGTPFVVKDADGRCYQLNPTTVYDTLPEDAVELGTPGSTVARATGCADESCVAQPAGDAYVKFTPCNPDGVTAEWWGCRARLPAAGLRVIAGACWCITPQSQTSNTITGTLLNAGIQLPDATCCACLNGRINAAQQWTNPFPCSPDGSLSSVRCAHGDLRQRSTPTGTQTVAQRCCCGRCDTVRFTLADLSYTETSTSPGSSYSGTVENVRSYQSDSVGNPNIYGDYIWVIYDFRMVNNGVTTVDVDRSFGIGVGCGNRGYPLGPGSVTGNTSPLQFSVPFPYNIGTVTGSCTSTTYSLNSSVTSGTSTSTWVGSGTITVTGSSAGCTGCGGNPSSIPGGSP